MTARPSPSPQIGVFDSGVGGLSVLRGLRRRLPDCAISYLADNRHLPYGAKSPEWLVERCATLTQVLVSQGSALVLVACNTATTHTIAALRQRWPSLPFVGVEPGVKPAIAASRSRRIAVLATEATLQSERMRSLVGTHGADAEVHLLACPGLADAIERAADDALETLIEDACARIEATQADTVVLGCTHYPLIADRIARRLGPGVALVDTAEAVCRRVESLLPVRIGAQAEPRGALSIAASGDVELVARAARRWLDEPVTVAHSAV
ncbi:glutamate racemase [Aquincola sp. S2]|uniref:Glutamate racemase n=2 Tax=Pseudaquabacterium terrae TaxID=2732868 RepID=A0ABX2EJ29_9BURK|nr:glutamate racemase [Aquabacterium terrae]